MSTPESLAEQFASVRAAYPPELAAPKLRRTIIGSEGRACRAEAPADKHRERRRVSQKLFLIRLKG
jgi:hypothetical protein